MRALDAANVEEVSKGRACMSPGGVRTGQNVLTPNCIVRIPDAESQTNASLLNSIRSVEQPNMLSNDVN